MPAPFFEAAKNDAVPPRDSRAMPSASASQTGQNLPAKFLDAIDKQNVNSDENAF
jgi:hypothetical protein